MMDEEKVAKVRQYEKVCYEGTCPHCGTYFEDEEETSFESGYIKCVWCDEEIAFEVKEDDAS